ncbi:hypothetical protein D3C76_1735010 [compost metagenome]
MMIQPLGAPIILQHAEVKIIAAHGRQLSCLELASPEPAFNLFALQQLGFCPLIIRNRSHT